VNAENSDREAFVSDPALTLPVDRTEGGATTVQAYAGRMFYAGFGTEVTEGDIYSPDMGSHVLFSQVIEGSEDFSKCYQVGDPTYAPDPTLVATDGGFIRIAEAIDIVGMEVAGAHLFVFASNGVWQITGNDRSGFSADSFQVIKVSNFGTRLRESIVSSEGSVFYWGDAGMYTITQGSLTTGASTGTYNVQDISKDTIQAYYNDLIQQKDTLRVAGAYDPFIKTVVWTWSYGDIMNTSYVAGRLKFSRTLNAFSVDEIGNMEGTSPHIITPLPVELFSANTLDFNIVAGSDNVVAGVDNVIASVTSSSDQISGLKYTTLSTDNGTLAITFSEFTDGTFTDWQKFDSVGVDAAGLMAFAPVTGGTISLHKQAPYLFLAFERTETGVEEEDGGDFSLTGESSCRLQSRWDFSSGSQSGKWSNERQAYRSRRHYIPQDLNDPFDTGYDLVISKNKLRGRGRALSIVLSTEPLKDCRLIGWSLLVNANQVG
jgi:hypothetical protein